MYCTQKNTYEQNSYLNLIDSFNPKKLLFLIPIFIGLGFLFASIVGGVGLFLPHSLQPFWFTHIIDTIRDACTDQMFWAMMVAGGVLALLSIGAGVYGIAGKTDSGRPTEYKCVTSAIREISPPVTNGSPDSEHLPNVSLDPLKPPVSTEPDKITSLPNELKISDRITTGASRCPVYLCDRGGKQLVLKFLHKHEYHVISNLDQNNEYTVPVVIAGEIQSLNISGDKEFDTHKNKYPCFIIMDYLNPSQLYNSEDDESFSEHCISEKLIPPLQSHMKLLENTKNDMIQCAKIIRYLHAKEIVHGDIKQENFGRDKNGQLKIFDFGESCHKATQKWGHYELDPKHNDILALGKLFVNMLSGFYVMAPGRHYAEHRFPLNQEKLVQIASSLPVSMPLQKILIEMLNIENPYSPDLLDKVIDALGQLQTPMGVNPIEN